MTYQELEALAKEAGFTGFGRLDPATIELKTEVRDMCAACQMYDKRWSCPPGCGSLEELARTLQGYRQGILVQSTGDIEDSFDFEAMQEIEATHRARFTALHEELVNKKVPHLALGAGCCTMCKTCTYPNDPCRFPEKMISSMEAWGMVVLEVCKANDLTYYYGSDKMTYTSCILF